MNILLLTHKRGWHIILTLISLFFCQNILFILFGGMLYKQKKNKADEMEIVWGIN